MLRMLGLGTHYLNPITGHAVSLTGAIPLTYQRLPVQPLSNDQAIACHIHQTAHKTAHLPPIPSLSLLFPLSHSLSLSLLSLSLFPNSSIPHLHLKQSSTTVTHIPRTGKPISTSQASKLGERPVPARCARMTLAHALTRNCTCLTRRIPIRRPPCPTQPSSPALPICRQGGGDEKLVPNVLPSR